MDENSNSGAVEITKTNHINEDHGWKTVTYHKKSKKQPQKQSGKAPAAADGVSSDRRSDVFRLIEQHSEERHRKWLEDQRAAAVATGDYPVVVDYGDGDDDDGSDGEGAAAVENGVGGAEEKKGKQKKPKKPKVTVSEAASKIDSSDLASFLADISVSLFFVPNFRVKCSFIVSESDLLTFIKFSPILHLQIMICLELQGKMANFILIVTIFMVLFVLGFI